MYKVVIAMLLTGLALVAQAQSASPFYGSWKVNWEGPKQAYESTLVLGEQGGTWKTLAHHTKNACVGQEVPVKITSISESEARLLLAFSEAIQGCPDSIVVLKAEGDAVTGTRGRGKIPLTLTRR